MDTCPVDVADLDAEPLRQLSAWLADARGAGEPMPDAMCLATASADGAPSARFVLMRGLDEGVVFFTNYRSDKARDLAANPRAAAVFHWYLPVHRQVRLRGGVAPVTAGESDRYWATRPPDSRRSAVASDQSAVIGSRDELEEAVASLGGTDPPRPAHWGGYRLTPTAVEFWQERPNRLHDRLRYVPETGGWRVERLAP
jgi:pyridoxamine 5'-phosphate oxidase